MKKTLLAIACMIACVAFTSSAAEAAKRHHRVAAVSTSLQCDNDGRCLYREPTNYRAIARVKRTASAHKSQQRPRFDAPGAEDHKATARGLITIPTAAGPVTVAPGFAGKISGFIADVVARGFHGRVKCFSLAKSHVPGSTHFSGNGCDFAQRGWGKTHPVMYRVADLAAKYGLRDGCSFRGRKGPDCGHIDNGMQFVRRHRLRLARRG